MSNDVPAENDTIAAVATPPGRGGVGIVRVSGPGAPAIATSLLGELPPARQAVLRDFQSATGEPLDRGLVLYFPAPRSFTGEHVLELHGHGGPVILDMLMQRVLQLGARPARPGEFSERAFLNNQLDLAQAEAIADLIDSGSQQAARAAMRSLSGEFSDRVHALVKEVTAIRVYVEAAIDFPDEEIDFLADKALIERVEKLQKHFDELHATATQGRLLRDGLTVVIAGPPNAGKSSLMNRLAGFEAAIVTDIPGTTRDMLRETIHLDGMPLHLVDTAGLREGGETIEREGMRRARSAMQSADRVLVVRDAAAGGEIDPQMLAGLPEGVPVTYVDNKIDMTGDAAAVIDGDAPTVCVSAKSGAGFDELRRHLRECVGYQGAATGTLSARRRHLDALQGAAGHVRDALRQLTEAAAGELAADDLRQAQQRLGEITGVVTSDDLLGEIFSSFCIGK
ncbi:MAG: tRNA uridine-5-carboxymethylaminomethyl(34) synthesis GTPase MnmE [Pseudomonadota bacterium]